MSYIVQLRARPGDVSRETPTKKRMAGNPAEKQLVQTRRSWLQTLWADVAVPEEIDDKFKSFGNDRDRDKWVAKWLVQIPGIKAGDRVRVISSGEDVLVIYFDIDAATPPIMARQLGLNSVGEGKDSFDEEDEDFDV